MEASSLQDQQRDVAVCGQKLAENRPTRFAAEGAHDPTASRYFVLEQLFEHFSFGPHSHLLDVGCGAGRVLAYFAQAGFSGRATGVELDPDLAKRAQLWARSFPQLAVRQGSVLDDTFDLSSFTDFYLFNPFNSDVLVRFIAKLECEACGPVTLVHMSDNGETYYYLGRAGWTLQAEGWIHHHEGVPVFGCAQHWSVWRFEVPPAC